jgi:hypothetical protein
MSCAGRGNLSEYGGGTSFVIPGLTCARAEFGKRRRAAGSIVITKRTRLVM